jgi:hypothetical protein
MNGGRDTLLEGRDTHQRSSRQMSVHHPCTGGKAHIVEFRATFYSFTSCSHGADGANVDRARSRF